MSDKESKPIDLETLLDPMALAKRVSHLEEVVGLLIYTVRHMGMGTFNRGEFLRNIKIDPTTYRLL